MSVMNNVKKAVLATGALAVLLQPALSFAWDGRYDNHGRGSRYQEHHYVRVIPRGCRPVVINGVRYYTDSRVYYVYTPYGYEAVSPAPVVVQQPVVVQPAPVVVTQPQTVYVSQPNQTRVAEGAVLGGILGALTGGIVGHQMKGHKEAGGALLGGAAGAAIGGIFGAQIPNQDAPGYR